MNDNRFTDYSLYRKPIGQKSRDSQPVVSEERRQISVMLWMCTSAQVVMGHGIRKRVIHAAAAAGPLVDVKSKNLFMAGEITLGESADLSANNYALIGLIKPHSTRYVGIIPAACNSSLCVRPTVEN